MNLNVSSPAIERRINADPLSLDLAKLWEQLLTGAFVIDDCQFTHETCQFSLSPRSFVEQNTLASSFWTTPRKRTIVERVLLGESQKVIALELGVVGSTIATICGSTLAAMAGESRAQRCPIVLVMSAHAARGYELPHARLHHLAERPACYRVSVQRPDQALPIELTTSEQSLVRYIMEGHTDLGIAQRRATSTRTVANQMASVFRKLGVSARGQLRAEIVRRFVSKHGDRRAAVKLTEPLPDFSDPQPLLQGACGGPKSVPNSGQGSAHDQLTGT